MSNAQYLRHIAWLSTLVDCDVDRLLDIMQMRGGKQRKAYHALLSEMCTKLVAQAATE